MYGPESLRLCDDELHWPKVWHQMATTRAETVARTLGAPPQPDWEEDNADVGDAVDEILLAHGVLPGDDPALEKWVISELDQPDPDP